MEESDFESTIVNTQHSEKNVTLIFLNDKEDSSEYTEYIKVYEEVLNSMVFMIKVEDIWFYRALQKPFCKSVYHLPALFLQSSSKSSVRVSYCTESEIESNPFICNRIFEELIPEINKDTKNIILLFTTSKTSDKVANDIVDMAALRLKPKSYNIWGGTCIKISKDPKTDLLNIPTCFGLAISCSNVETWSCILDYTSMRCVMTKDLVHFKNNIKLKNHNLGLIFGPWGVEDIEVIFGYDEENYYDKVCQTYSDVTSILEATFPEISFMGLFYERYEKIFGKDVFSKSYPNDQFVHQMALSLLIITYD